MKKFLRFLLIWGTVGFIGFAIISVPITAAAGGRGILQTGEDIGESIGTFLTCLFNEDAKPYGHSCKVAKTPVKKPAKKPVPKPKPRSTVGK